MMDHARAVARFRPPHTKYCRIFCSSHRLVLGCPYCQASDDNMGSIQGKTWALEQGTCVRSGDKSLQAAGDGWGSRRRQPVSKARVRRCPHRHLANPDSNAGTKRADFELFDDYRRPLSREAWSSSEDLRHRWPLPAQTPILRRDPPSHLACGHSRESVDSTLRLAGHRPAAPSWADESGDNQL